MAPHHRLKLWQNILLGIFCFPLLPFYLCVYCLCLKKDKKDVDEEHHQDIGHVEEARCVQENQNIHLSFTNKGFKTDVEKNKEKKFIEIGHLEEAQCVQENQNIHLSFTNKGFKSDVEESKPKKHTEIASSYLIYTGKVLSKDIIRCLNIWLVTIGRKQDGKKEEVENQEDIGQVKDGQKSQNKHKKFSSSNKVHIEHDETVNTKRETQTDKPAFSYPWDKSNLKSLQIDLEAFKELDSYASKVKANGTLDLLVRDLLRDARTDLEKTRAIWIWICHHIEYDVAGLKNLSQVSTKAEDILRTRKGVCAGYSSLFQKMCSIAGVQCKKASGYSKGAGYKLGQTFSGDTDHAWNLVYLEKGWHLLDSTWGAGHADSNISKFTFKYDEYYFLTHPALFIEDHFPEQKKDQLLVPAVSLKQFEQKVRHTSQFYNLGLLSSQPDTAIIQTDKGKVSITIESHHPVEFIFHLNQTEEPGLLTLNKHGMKLNLYPRKTGEHILQIFARTLESEESYDFVLEYKVYCREVDSSINIPKCLCQPVGPSWLSEKAGLLRPSQLDPVIHTEDGCCKFSFALRPGLSLFSTLKSEQIQMTPKMTNRHIFQTHKEDMVDFMVRLPQSGTYVFCVHVKDKNNEDYITQCNYLITCKNSAVLWPEFPLVYVGWANHYKLVEPLDGVLPNNSIVPFKLHIPEVCGVSVRGKSSFPLTLNSDGYWEGTCNTENSKEIYVSVTYADQPNSYTYVLQYLVQERNI